MKSLFNNIVITFNMCRICSDVSSSILPVDIVFLLLSFARVQANDFEEKGLGYASKHLLITYLTPRGLGSLVATVSCYNWKKIISFHNNLAFMVSKTGVFYLRWWN